jgi:phosphoglucosamine mutase
VQQAVQQYRADMGIALDGDGDRVAMVDHRGEILDGDEILLIIADARQAAGTLKGPVVGTLMSNLGLEEALRDRGIEMCRSKVGDRYVLETMRERGGMLGGETSGHIICLDRVTSGDGIVSALQVLHAIRERNTTLHEIKQGMRKYPQVLINVRLPRSMDAVSLPGVQDSVRKAEAELGDHGRVLLRPSGTEPLVRVMVEGQNQTQVQRIARRIADCVEKAINGDQDRSKLADTD